MCNSTIIFHDRLLDYSIFSGAKMTSGIILRIPIISQPTQMATLSCVAHIKSAHFCLPCTVRIYLVILLIQPKFNFCFGFPNGDLKSSRLDYFSKVEESLFQSSRLENYQALLWWFFQRTLLETATNSFRGGEVLRTYCFANAIFVEPTGNCL